MSKVEPGEDAPTRTRDRDGTARAIVLAAREVLAEEGFQSFGVNAIARRAGCDKQLIYRYFGGLEGVADAIGDLLGEEIKERLGALRTQEAPRTYAALMQTMAAGLVDLMRASPLVRQINAWELAAPSPLVARLAAARSRQLLAWSIGLRGDLAPPAGIDTGAANALILAAAEHLAMSGMAVGAYAAVPLRSEADWLRAKAALHDAIAAIYREA